MKKMYETPVFEEVKYTKDALLASDNVVIDGSDPEGIGGQEDIV